VHCEENNFKVLCSSLINQLLYFGFSIYNMNQKRKNSGIYPKHSTRLFCVAGIGAIGILLSLFFIVNSCKDSCQDVTCKNGGSCIDGNCDCPDGYSGPDCGTNISANFLGTYNVSEQCPNDTTYTVNIAVDSLNITGVKIANFFNSFSNLVNATVNQTNITIPLQAPDNDGRSVSGSGTFHPPDQIVWNYSVGDASGTISCSNSVWQR